MTVTITILGNAVTCGVLSNAHDRYGARIAWVPLLVSALVLLRWQSRAAPSRRDTRVAVPFPGPAARV
ncbi:MAG TPA: hypothetical protein VE909_11640, partial [Xanthobacteraceae bacterium]|nr:hypothetical protein [Xanthobacteraceae bacterium]